MASDDDPAGESSDVGSDVCVVPDPIPTAVSVRTVVTEKWMDRFVIDLVEFPGRGVHDSGDSFNMGTIRTGVLCCVRRRGF